MMLPVWLLAFLATFGYAAPAAELRGMACRDVTTTVHASAQNKILPQLLNVDDLTSSFLNTVVAGLPTALVGGEYQMGGRYCEPETHAKNRSDTLVVLVHGLTYNVNYWSGLAEPGTRHRQDAYSWITEFSKLGYHTLSVDRLCNGRSTKANGITECQLPLETEAMHGVLQAARHGRIPGVRRKFARLFYIGHSYGSQTGNALSLQHPAAVDGMVLTGFTQHATFGEAGAIKNPLFLPASTVRPREYGALSDPAYTAASDYEGTTTLFYHGDYAERMARADFKQRGTFQVGEGATVQLGQVRAPEFDKPLFVLNGNDDAIFCALNPANTVNRLPGNCDKGGFSAEVRSSYPKVTEFEFHNIPNTGHDIQLHRTSHTAFRLVHGFMARHGF